MAVLAAAVAAAAANPTAGCQVGRPPVKGIQLPAARYKLRCFRRLARTAQHGGAQVARL